MKTTLFWVITQRVMAISYRRFETIYRSQLQGLRIHDMLFRVTYAITDYVVCVKCMD